MSLIVAARFIGFADAEKAAMALFKNDFKEEDVSIFFVNPPGMNNGLPTGGDETADRSARSSPATTAIGLGIGAAIGTAIGAVLVSLTELTPIVAAAAGGIGAYVGSLVGALNGMSAKPQTRERGLSMDSRPSGVLLAVHVAPGTETLASKLLKDYGGQDVERASGQWRDGKWQDFDAVVPPVLSDKVPTSVA